MKNVDGEVPVRRSRPQWSQGRTREVVVVMTVVDPKRLVSETSSEPTREIRTRKYGRSAGRYSTQVDKSLLFYRVLRPFTVSLYLRPSNQEPGWRHVLERVVPSGNRRWTSTPVGPKRTSKQRKVDDGSWSTQ